MAIAGVMLNSKQTNRMSRRIFILIVTINVRPAVGRSRAEIGRRNERI
jgi:hypothetical protein